MGDGIERSMPFRSVSLARAAAVGVLDVGIGRVEPGRLHRLVPVGLQAVLVELEGMSRRHDDEPPRPGPSHPSGPLLEFTHRVGQSQVEAYLQVRYVDAPSPWRWCWPARECPPLAALPRSAPGASAPTGRPWRLWTSTIDGVLGDDSVAASMPAAARSASCRSSMKAMYDRSGSSLITSRTAACKSRQPSSWGSRPTDVLHGEFGAGDCRCSGRPPPGRAGR